MFYEGYKYMMKKEDMFIFLCIGKSCMIEREHEKEMIIDDNSVCEFRLHGMID